jgi:hypothetical protein
VFYQNFTERMEKRLKEVQNMVPTVTNIMSREDISIRQKRSRDEAPTPIRDRLIGNQSISSRFLKPFNPFSCRTKQPSLTNEIINTNGECAIFVDSDRRDGLIPKATRFVYDYYLELDEKGFDYEITTFSKVTKERGDKPSPWIFDNIGYYDFEEQTQNILDSQQVGDEYIVKMVFDETLNGMNGGNARSPEEIYAKILKNIVDPKPILKVKYTPNMTVINENDECDTKTNKSNLTHKSFSSGSVVDSLK